MENVICERRDGSTFETTAAWAEANAQKLEFHGTVVVGPALETPGEPVKPVGKVKSESEKKGSGETE